MYGQLVVVAWASEVAGQDIPHHEARSLEDHRARHDQEEPHHRDDDHGGRDHLLRRRDKRGDGPPR